VVSKTRVLGWVETLPAGKALANDLVHGFAAVLCEESLLPSAITWSSNAASAASLSTLTLWIASRVGVEGVLLVDMANLIVPVALS